MRCGGGKRIFSSTCCAKRDDVDDEDDEVEVEVEVKVETEAERGTRERNTRSRSVYLSRHFCERD